jgi:hypothetical protein
MAADETPEATRTAFTDAEAAAPEVPGTRTAAPEVPGTRTDACTSEALRPSDTVDLAAPFPFGSDSAAFDAGPVPIPATAVLHIDSFSTDFDKVLMGLFVGSGDARVPVEVLEILAEVEKC